jgi:hypothetical protein
MWCVIEAADVNKDLRNDPLWGWVHHGQTGYHTVGGTPLELRNGKFEPVGLSVPAPPAISIDLGG